MSDKEGELNEGKDDYEPALFSGRKHGSISICPLKNC